MAPQVSLVAYETLTTLLPKYVLTVCLVTCGMTAPPVRNVETWERSNSGVLVAIASNACFVAQTTLHLCNAIERRK